MTFKYKVTITMKTRIKKNEKIALCMFSLFVLLVTPYVYADSATTRLITDNKMCLEKVDVCVMAKKFHFTPLKQIYVGLGALDIECNTNFQLVLKATDYKPACVSPSIAQELVKRGWALSQDDLAKLRATFEPNTP